MRLMKRKLPLGLIPLILALFFSALLSLNAFGKEAYIVHLSAKGIGASSFGHTYFAISNGNIKRAKLYEFVAETGERINFFRGIGLGESYNLLLKKVTFFKERREQLLNEDRDITFYKLDLPVNQINTIESELESKEESVNQENHRYNFFTRNCTSLWAEIFRDTVGTKYSVFDNIPSLFIKNLKRNGIITEQFKIERFSKQRSEALRKYFGSDYQITMKRVLKLAKSQNLEERKIALLYLASFNNDDAFQEYRRFEMANLGNHYAKKLRGNIDLKLFEIGQLDSSARRLRLSKKGNMTYIRITNTDSSYRYSRIKDHCNGVACDYFIYKNKLVKAEFYWVP